MSNINFELFKNVKIGDRVEVEYKDNLECLRTSFQNKVLIGSVLGVNDGYYMCIDGYPSDYPCEYYSMQEVERLKINTINADRVYSLEILFDGYEKGDETEITPPMLKSFNIK